MQDAKSAQEMKGIRGGNGGESFRALRDRLKKEDDFWDNFWQDIQKAPAGATITRTLTLEKGEQEMKEGVPKDVKEGGIVAHDAPSGAMPGSSRQNAERPAAMAAATSRPTCGRNRSRSKSGRNRCRRSPAAEPERELTEELTKWEMDVEGTFKELEVPVQDKASSCGEVDLDELAGANHASGLAQNHPFREPLQIHRAASTAIKRAGGAILQ